MLSLTLTGQNLVKEYMKVQSGWMEIHKERIEKVMITGWQLWRNVYAAVDDLYEYVTINWYKNWAHSIAPASEGFCEEMGTLANNMPADGLLSLVRMERDAALREGCNILRMEPGKRHQ